MAATGPSRASAAFDSNAATASAALPHAEGQQAAGEASGRCDSQLLEPLIRIVDEGQAPRLVSEKCHYPCEQPNRVDGIHRALAGQDGDGLLGIAQGLLQSPRMNLGHGGEVQRVQDGVAVFRLAAGNQRAVCGIVRSRVTKADQCIGPLAQHVGIGASIQRSGAPPVRLGFRVSPGPRKGIAEPGQCHQLVESTNGGAQLDRPLSDGHGAVRTAHREGQL